MDPYQADGVELREEFSGFETIQWNRMQNNLYFCLMHQSKGEE
jgi:hypothetical protein